jgi:hypothetical protein
MAAFFQNEPEDEQLEDTQSEERRATSARSAPREAREEPDPATPEKLKKVRTTVTLYPDTLALMELMKVQARRDGARATYSDILEEAIVDLAEKRGLELSDYV